MIECPECEEGELKETGNKFRTGLMDGEDTIFSQYKCSNPNCSHIELKKAFVLRVINGKQVKCIE